jgi:hypothetical protein
MKIKELLRDKEVLKSSMSKFHTNENELKNKIETLKIENITLSQNLTMFNDVQRKYEDVLKENKLLRKENDSVERKRDKIKDELESKEKLLE